MKTTQSNRVMGLREWALLLILSILWGGAFFFSKLALVELPPFTVVLGRVGIAALALQLAVILSGERMPTAWPLWGRFVIMGALNNLIPFSLIFYGQTQLASGLAAILNATTPLWTVLLAHWLTRDERMTPNRIGGVLAGLIGVTIMVGPGLLSGIGTHSLAQLAVIGAALSYAGAGIFGKGFRGLPPLVVAAGQVTTTTVLMVPIALLVDRPWALPMPGLTTWGALVGLALLSTALTVVIYFRLLATVGATNLLLVTFLNPVSALLLGTLILGEGLTFGELMGMGWIGIGLAVIDGRILRWLWARRTVRVAEGS